MSARYRSIPALFTALALSAGVAAAPPGDEPWDEQSDGPLPRWREGGTPLPDPDRPLQPYAVQRPFRAAPTSGLIESPPEYAPAAGVLFRYSTAAWSDVVTDCVAALTGDPAHDEIAYVVVSSTSQRNAAISQFTAAGADLARVQFILLPTDSIWLRDYGPHFIWQSGALAIADSHYYPSRPLDNFIPTLLGEDSFVLPAYAMGLYYSGGNFQPGPLRSGYTTSLVHEDNPGFGERFIGDLFEAYQGIDKLHIFPQMPYSVDGTGHIDMWMYLVDADTVIISEFLPGSHPTAIEITENAVVYMEDLGFEVFRTPDHNGYHPYDPGCHFTYTNAFRVNDRIFIPSYGGTHAARDLEAHLAFQAAAPDAEIIAIDCYSIIPAAGAIHCIVMQVPRFTSQTPAAHVVAPDGGELLAAGSTVTLRWAASDDVAVSSVDLRYSIDGGLTFPNVIATGEPDDGSFDWTVPDEATAGARIQVTAHDDDGNAVEAISADVFEIAPAPRATYDFSVLAGIDRWGWGYQTLSWSELSGVRYPPSASTEISSLVPQAYDKIAFPDAEGGDFDGDRYVAPTPQSGRESTHIFEFTIAEDPASIRDIALEWEGYGDACLQMELYVWDGVVTDWCNGHGEFGENRYLDNFAGNRDGGLVRHLRSDFERYIDADGRLTLLAYAERSSQESFHDYVGVVVTYEVHGDVDGDGDVSVTDLVEVILSFGPCPEPPLTCPADVTGDGVVDVQDLVEVILSWNG